jgi:hypothetical protein
VDPQPRLLSLSLSIYFFNPTKEALKRAWRKELVRVEEGEGEEEEWRNLKGFGV